MRPRADATSGERIASFSSGMAPRDALPERNAGPRAFATSRGSGRVSAGRFDALDALQAARQQAAALGARAAVFDEIGPFQRELALPGVERDLALAFADDRDAGHTLTAGKLRLRNLDQLVALALVEFGKIGDREHQEVAGRRHDDDAVARRVGDERRRE